MRIDLHTHSTASDGTERPSDVIAAATRAGLDVVALTDHDTTAGWDEATTAAQQHGIALVRGAEISARSHGTSVHLLSYLHDPAHPDLLAEIGQTRSARLSRAQQMVGLLAEDYPVTWEHVVAQSGPDTVVGRPHIADALVALGVVPSRDAAFADLLTADSRYYVPHHAPDAVVAVRAIRAAGGVPVFAHPGATGRGRIVPDEVFDELAEAGLAGMEIGHRDHSTEQAVRLLGIAARLGMLVTGSSDYHGAGKLNRLGEHLTPAAVLDAIEEQGHVEVVRP